MKGDTSVELDLLAEEEADDIRDEGVVNEDGDKIGAGDGVETAKERARCFNFMIFVEFEPTESLSGSDCSLSTAELRPLGEVKSESCLSRFLTLLKGASDASSEELKKEKGLLPESDIMSKNHAYKIDQIMHTERANCTG